MFHVLSVIILTLVMMIVTFSTDNPLIILSVLLWSIYLLIKDKDYKSLKMGYLLMIPMIIITGVINIILVNAGNIVLFTIGNKAITLEILVYVFVTSMKLLVIIYLFSILSNMLDTDGAVSYFSKRSPRITLIILLCLKLIPNMKKRLNSLKETYIVRGVNLDANTKKEVVKGYVPILSILLEDSLEKSFDIGESAYVRGFSSGKRSEYDKAILEKKDYIIIGCFLSILVYHIVFIILGKVSFSIYDSESLFSFINVYSIVEVILVVISLIIMEIFRNKRR